MGQFPGYWDAPNMQGGIDIMMSVSRDGGLSWEMQLRETWKDANGDGIEQDGERFLATVIQEPLNTTGVIGMGHADQPHVTVGPEGHVYVSQYGSGDFSIHHSIDAGASFVGPDHETGERIAFGLGLDTNVRVEGLPNNRFRTQTVRAIVADPARPGAVYAVEPDWNLDSLGKEVDPADVLFGRSANYGETWQTSFQLGPNEADVLNDDNDGRLATGVQPGEVTSGQAMARPAVNARGDIGVVWYDTRGDWANHLVDVYGTFSTDGGQTFTPHFALPTSLLTPTKACLSTRWARRTSI